MKTTWLLPKPNGIGFCLGPAGGICGAASLSGRSQLTKPHRALGNSPRLLPAQKWLP